MPTMPAMSSMSPHRVALHHISSAFTSPLPFTMWWKKKSVEDAEAFGFPVQSCRAKEDSLNKHKDFSKFCSFCSFCSTPERLWKNQRASILFLVCFYVEFISNELHYYIFSLFSMNFVEEFMNLGAQDKNWQK